MLSGPAAIRALARGSRELNMPGIPTFIWRCFPPAQVPRVQGTLRLKNGQLFRIDTRELIDWHLFFFGQYEPEIGSLIRSRLQPGDVAIDAGANVGVHTVSMAMAARGGTVLACEPNPAAAKTLGSNLALNGHENVQVCQIALGDHPGTVELHVPPAEWQNTGMASLLPLAAWPIVQVECKTIDDLILGSDLKPVGLIKIDVEGWEPAVLRGATEVLRTHRPDLIFEYQSDYWARSGSDLPSVLDELSSVGYSLVKRIGTKGLEPLPEPLPASLNLFLSADRGFL